MKPNNTQETNNKTTIKNMMRNKDETKNTKTRSIGQERRKRKHARQTKQQHKYNKRR